ncbi:hypothetical protein AMTR_s00003p00242490 [Amborella trichopoda]|uniref:Uncharacterized protein n=2 Tax=Amborella trichopoda TaxID=13333 RepID=W1P0I2_AMBTC|nr:hypothetical protein AMTR_s00003p00242490 [Amborella trichopoda]
MAHSLNHCFLLSLLLFSFPTVLSLPRKPLFLVPTASPVLEYHRGPLLTNPINVYILYYGHFHLSRKYAIADFFASFLSPNTATPSVQTWWRTALSYTDLSRRPVSNNVSLAGMASDLACSAGKTLTRNQLPLLIKAAMRKQTLPMDPSGLYLILTSDDTIVERFCMSSCGTHGALLLPRPGPKTGVDKTGGRAVWAWVGDPSKQCPGLCAWPYAKPLWGPPSVLMAPGGDVGLAGMVINVATMLVGSATNPYGDGFYEGDPLVPVEASTACPGLYGKDGFAGYPGTLLVDPTTNASFNAYGVGSHIFLLPAIWDPLTRKCKANV